jgi:hypothetical protein
MLKHSFNWSIEMMCWWEHMVSFYEVVAKKHLQYLLEQQSKTPSHCINKTRCSGCSLTKLHNWKNRKKHEQSKRSWRNSWQLYAVATRPNWQLYAVATGPYCIVLLLLQLPMGRIEADFDGDIGYSSRWRRRLRLTTGFSDIREEHVFEIRQPRVDELFHDFLRMSLSPNLVTLIPIACRQRMSLNNTTKNEMTLSHPLYP